jgi:hypothetical protein
MFHPDILAALAKDRHNTMLAEAAAAGLARQVRQTRRERRVPGSPEAPEAVRGNWWFRRFHPPAQPVPGGASRGPLMSTLGSALGGMRWYRACG